MISPQGKYLFFENDLGSGDVMELESVKQLLQEQKAKLQVVFLAACHSEPFGKAFVEAGVPHVLCVNE